MRVSSGHREHAAISDQIDGKDVNIEGSTVIAIYFVDEITLETRVAADTKAATLNLKHNRERNDGFRRTSKTDNSGIRQGL